MLAANGDLSTLGITLPEVDSEAQTCDYNPADLAEAAPEIRFDQTILKLAKQLDYNPLKIYEYVANHISYQAYFGSLKGATATLVSGSGNATDQASLIIALLRVSKIPARYVRGHISFAPDDERGFNWMGAKGLEGFKQIDHYHVSVVDNNDTVIGYGLKLHTWIEACIPYDNYRGSRADASGYHWIPLDPSYEQKDYVQGTTVPDSFDLNDFFYGTDGYMLKRSLQLPHEAFEERLAQKLGKAIEPIGNQGTKRLVKQDILPSTLPYHVLGFAQWGDGITSSDTATLPQNHRFVFRITVKDKHNNVLHPRVDLNMPEIASKRVTLRFDGATQSQIDKNNCVVNPFVTPVLSIDGDDLIINGKQSVRLCTPKKSAGDADCQRLNLY
ncbi:MAG: transglutaminase-like domain-containing protein [gamma proteobacterium symbiont of Bathyaustriella thionipta]|nr:transglutaminase-like domain-containing protein [gamma proteobacterium symbiont of Bathyaustriella thionipta]MCU7951424.1 transglutaminase-like domain-containing protein [gamma proteobacterium symbiont of Bathyaustriella thionipta]MCU7952513.1 transglutaminase-like domain-containing protein [gamma proteobacterium symbiont of Bathyaustriella thionipta]MCU7957977.1 transglutaminase-like domain-containing protein [gamma proteobacterium symbiont of Bathyaustriella thionipta]MCU7966518.1 transglu